MSFSDPHVHAFKISLTPLNTSKRGIQGIKFVKTLTSNLNPIKFPLEISNPKGGFRLKNRRFFTWGC